MSTKAANLKIIFFGSFSVLKHFILEMADLGFFGGGSDSSDSEEETVQGDFRFILDRDSR